MDERRNMEKLLTQQEVAELLQINPETLNVWRATGRYNLRYFKIGRLVRYKLSDVLDFIDSRTIEAL